MMDQLVSAAFNTLRDDSLAYDDRTSVLGQEVGQSPTKR